MNTTNDMGADAEPKLVTPTRSEDFIAASVCFIVSCLSLCMNGSVVVSMLRLQTMKTQFRYLCISLAAADGGVLAVFGFWMVPLTFSQNSDLAAGFIGKKIGQLSLFFWFASLYLTLAIAVNRLLAISYPVPYNIWFSRKNTLKVIALCWMLALAHMPVYFFHGCDFFYDPPLYIWMYAQTNCGPWIGLLLDFGYGMVFFALIFTLNVITGFKLRQINQAGVISSTQRGQEKAERRRNHEKRFLIQACFNAIIFELLMISFHGFSRLATEKWGWFFTTTIIWQISHASNGFLMLFFNPLLHRGMTLDKNVVGQTAAAAGGQTRRGSMNLQQTSKWQQNEVGKGPTNDPSDHRPERLPYFSRSSWLKKLAERKT